jgi:hypothetical protein
MFTCDTLSCTYYAVKKFKQIVTPGDGRIRPKHAVEREGDNKRVSLWTEV